MILGRGRLCSTIVLLNEMKHLVQVERDSSPSAQNDLSGNALLHPSNRFQGLFNRWLLMKTSLQAKEVGRQPDRLQLY